MAPQFEDVQASTETSNIQNPSIEDEYKLPTHIGTDLNYKHKIVWFNAIGFLYLHLAALYGIFLLFFSDIRTIPYVLLLMIVSGFGVTIGAHRLYTHKTFKAIWPVRLVLVTLQTLAGQNCMWVWVRDHRQHHKYSDTDADPHNANRGFFFAHIGWLMCRKHPLVISKGKGIDMSDIEADSLVMLQKRFYKTFYMIFAIGIPVAIPVYFWNESVWNSFFTSYVARTVLQLNFTWLVNSWAHFYGMRPFDTRLKPVESVLVSSLGLGEGWHNYHHAFPWDYRAAELGSNYNLSTSVIDLLAAAGWAYDLKTTNFKMIQQRSLKHGDGSHILFNKEAQKNYQETLENQKNDPSHQLQSRSISVKG